MQEINGIALHYLETSPEMAAAALEKCSIDERVSFLMSLTSESASKFIPHAPSYLALAFLTTLDIDRCLNVLDRLDPKLSSAYLRRFEPESRQKILDRFPEYKKRLIQSRLTYLPGTAGYLMDTSSSPLKLGLSIKDALEILGRDMRAHHYIYVVNDDEKLVGVTTIRKLIQESDRSSLIDDVMTKNIGVLFADDEKQEILSKESWKKFVCLPVVDYSDKFLGVLDYETYGTLRDSYPTDDKSKDLESINNSLVELYGIGFSALVGSTSALVPEKDKA